MSAVRVGLVGCGFSANLHIGGYEQLGPERCQLAAVCGVPKASAEAFAAKHSIPAAFGGMDEMLAGVELDAVDSHADYARQWRTSGGGSLMVKGSHPLGAAIQLKRWEGEEKFGQPIRPASVMCEVGNLTWIEAFKQEEAHHLRTGWRDVEDWGIIVVKFEDGSVAEVKAADTTLGGVHNYLEAYLSNARIRANINPNDSCVAYAPEADIFEPEYISEKIETKGGWTFPSPDEDWHQGYPQEIADFITAIVEDREPAAGAALAREVTLVLYAAYVAAEEGRRVDLKPILG